MNIQDIDPKKNIRGIAIGRPKSGKTVGLCSFPGKIMVFDIDNRIESVLKMYPERKNIFCERYGRDDYEILEQDINRHCNDKSYDMYILDSVTTLGDCLINYSMKLRGVGKDARMGRAKGKIQLTEVEDFGAEANGLTKVINTLLEVEHAHVFVTAHVLSTTAWDLETKKEVIHSTILTAGKKVAAKIPTQFNEIWAFSYRPGIGPNDIGGFFVNTIPTIEVPYAGSVLSLPAKVEFTLPKHNLWQALGLIKQEVAK